MKILIAHNRYQQAGGEDAVARTEARLLRDFGQEVHVYERDNREIEKLSAPSKLGHFLSLGFSRHTFTEFQALLKKVRPDVVHFHNTFFMMTPSVYFACREEKVAVVQSLHNFRLLCSNGLFFRDGRVCEECLDHSLWRGVRYGCYRQSRLVTALTARMIEDHWRKRTWTDMVDRYLTATEFGRRKFIERGLSPQKISVKPNFLYPDVTRRDEDGGYALYIGRLSHEKGVDVLLSAWQRKAIVPLKIIGDGPMAGRLNKFRHLKNLEILGYVSNEQYEQYLSRAKFLIVPSLCYENFPRVVVEAYAFGVPVIASRLGGMPEIVIDGKTGLLFDAGHPYDLVEKVQRIMEDGRAYTQMRMSARNEYEKKYSAQKSYEGLMTVYTQLIGEVGHAR